MIMVPGNAWDGNRSASTTWRCTWRSTPRAVGRPADFLPDAAQDPSAAAALRDARLRPVAPNIMRLTPVTVPGVTRPGAPRRRSAPDASRRAARRRRARGAGPQHDRGLADRHAGRRAGREAGVLRHRRLRGRRRAHGNGPSAGSSASSDASSPRPTSSSPSRPCSETDWAERRDNVHLVPNGCLTDRLAGVEQPPLPADVTLPRPVAGFVGHMSDRIDLAMLEAVAATGASLLLVGPRQPTFQIAKLDALLALPNVQWVGSKPFDELPSYLRAIDVGLTPYRQSAFNHASFPLKTLEYLAAGRPAAVSDLPAHRWLDTHHVTIASTPEAFARRTTALLATRRRSEDVAARRAFAARHSWAARAEQVCGLLGIDRVDDRASAA